MARAFHVIGAGLAGLSAAIRLSQRGETVVVHEAAGQAGGRCRSYHDPALDMEIDNGNHLLLSANRAAIAFLATIGSADRLVGPPHADFPFVDLKRGERWTLKIGDGRLPWWMFDAGRRVPGTRARDYLSIARLLWPRREAAVGDIIACKGALYERLVGPLLLAALNTAPPEGSAALAAAVLRETIARGGRACRPLIARDGLGPTFIAPALAFLGSRGVAVGFGRRLRALGFAGDKAATLDFGDETIRLAGDDRVILAVPPVVATALVPGLTAPTAFRAIVNAHFRMAPPATMSPIIGVINGTTEWIFAFPDRLSVTISGADRLLDTPREELAKTIWREVAAVAQLSDTDALPPWQIVRERRATFAAIPAQERLRPGTRTQWRNLWLAGDWTATGLPATIEGAIRSGERAAELALH
ncbi:MAG TPA: hydroxysqualene dehydroxylase HpnE [Xanthobacteraceae bacterium]|nr:hydroxysqualene dehydroxylase HpnE [Xanthobacteraceae bacterium]